MTNFEAISASLYPFSVDDALIRKVCIDNSLNSEDEYSGSNKQEIAVCSINILKMLVVLSSESNGGYSLSYNTDQVKQRIWSIAHDNGLADIAEEFESRSVIIDVSDKW